MSKRKRSERSGRVALGAALAGFLLAAPSFAETPTPVESLADGRSGKIYFTSLTPKNPLEMAKRRSTTKVVVDGVLSFPADAKGPLPAMVIAHGSGGILPSYVLWTAALNRAGIATFVIDSWGGRGITSTRYDQSQVSTAANVADAFFALRLLATHPRIDAKRIGVMGFSRGGAVALYTTLEPLRRAVIDGDLHFAAHVPFYPDCNFRWTAAEHDGSPILMLLGQRYDWTPAAPWRLCGLRQGLRRHRRPRRRRSGRPAPRARGNDRLPQGRVRVVSESGNPTEPQRFIACPMRARRYCMVRSPGPNLVPGS